MSRSLKKGPFVESHLLEKIDKMNNSGAKKPIKTWSRRSMVTPDFVGHTFSGSQRKDFSICFRDRKHGWSQARRIFAYAGV